MAHSFFLHTHTPHTWDPIFDFGILGAAGVALVLNYKVPILQFNLATTSSDASTIDKKWYHLVEELIEY